MEEKDKKYQLGEENYSTDMNGRTDFTDVPESKRPITYYNPILDKEQTQNYTENADILVVPLIRKNDKGELEFGLIEKEVPATIATEGGQASKPNYNGVLLEAPTIALPTKEILDNSQITNLIDEKMLDLGMYLEGYSTLDDSKTPVSQSFTNQCAQFYVVAVSETEKQIDQKSNEDLHWFSLGMLTDFIEQQREADNSNIHSSLQTMYGLVLLKRKYQEEISKMQQIDFELDRPIKGLELVSENVKAEHKYRFGINDITYKDRNGKIQYSTYSTSKDSIQCGLISKNKETSEREIGLSIQQRSPFVADEKFNGKLSEITAGMIEPGQSRLDAAIAEAKQEQGCLLSEKDVKHLYGPLLPSISTSELTDFFIADADKGVMTEQELDEEEIIGAKKDYNLQQTANNPNQLKAPLPTKFLIVLAQDDFEREDREKEKGQER